MTPRGWAITGAGVGLLAGSIVFAPAAWLARAVASATDQRLLLADAEGTLWSGSARPVLTGGADSRDAAVLPGRLSWQIRLAVSGIELLARQPCCLTDTLLLRVRPGLGRVTVTVPASDGPLGHWPLVWLAGLGTPWNTLQLSGQALLTSRGLTVESVQGRWRVDGGAELEMHGVGSQLTTLPELGSYRLTVTGGGEAANLLLSTISGALLLQASGQWAASGLRLRGTARAAPGAEAALDNLLNIIGRRRGAESVLSIG